MRRWSAVEAKMVMVNFGCWKRSQDDITYSSQVQEEIGAEINSLPTANQSVGKACTIWSSTTPRYPRSAWWLLHTVFKTHISLSKSLTPPPRARMHGSAAQKSFYLLISGSPELSSHLSSTEQHLVHSQFLRAVVLSAWDPEGGDIAEPCDSTSRGNLILDIAALYILDWQVYGMVYRS